MAPGFGRASRSGVEDLAPSYPAAPDILAIGPGPGPDGPPRVGAVHTAEQRNDRGVGGRHLVELDGLRGLAILMVLAFHFMGVMPAGLASQNPFCKLLTRLAASGWCGVDLFFVLSGFLITGILYDTKGSRRYFLTFYARRALRIFPLYYGVLVAVFVMAPRFLHPDADFRRLLDRQAWFWLYGVNILRVWEGARSCGAGGLSLEHFWSLAVEEHFYLLWPVVVLSFGRVAVMRVCVLMSAVALLSRWILARSGYPFAVYMLTPCRIDALAMGGLLALAMRGGEPGRIKARARLALLTSGLALAVLLARGHGLLLLSDRIVQLIGYSLLAVFFASAVALAIDAPRGVYGASLRSGPLAFLGKYSYGIYVYHFIIYNWLWRALTLDALAGVVGPGLPSVVAHVATCASLSVAASWLSWQVYERHFVAAKALFPYKRRSGI